MAFYDWNHDGKNDMMDDFIEYQGYKDATGQDIDDPHFEPARGKGLSNFGCVLSVIAGLVISSLLISTLGIDVDKVPAFVLLILWCVFTAITAAIFDKIGL